MTTLTLVIPLYREAPRLADTIRQISAFSLSEPEVEVDTIFVNDGSPDDTETVVTNLIAESGIPRTRMISYAQNQGKGYAVKTGVLAATGELILMSDCDLSSPLIEWRKLKQAIDAGADFACGSRVIPGADIGKPQPFHRRLLGKLFRLFIHLAGVRGVHDTQCGFKLFKSGPAKEVFGRLRIRRFAFDVEMIVTAQDLGYRVQEVPVHWDYSGFSTVRVISNGSKMLWDVFCLMIRRFFRKAHR